MISKRIDEMFKKLILIVLLSVNFSSYATTDQSINVESLMLQRSYLKGINQCAQDKPFVNLMKSAVKDANTFYEHGSYAQTIEEVILQNPACFVASTNKLSQKECETLNEKYIKEPFFYPRAMLTDALGKVKGMNQSCLAG